MATAAAESERSTYAPDYLSTLPTRDLHEIYRSTQTLPLADLLNRQTLTVDYERRRIWRDTYWKGSFARDTPMGWEERLMASDRRGLPPYARGRFWKRFDDIREGAAIGHVVNYGLLFLPGHAVVRQVTYPDDKRRYIRAGDDILLLRYTNHPYRTVYDLIKIVDKNHCIGVMHLGSFPNGLVFSTFLLARNNYPFEKMTVPDHDAIFSGDHVHAPSASDLEGSWKGYVVFFRHPETAMHNQFNPPLLRVRFHPAGAGVEARVRRGLIPSRRQVRFEGDRIRLTGAASSTDEIRQIDADTLIGRTVRHRSDAPAFRYVLRRTG